MRQVAIIKIILWGIILPLSKTAFGQGAKPDTARLGMYLKNLSNLSPQNFSFEADMYVWSNSLSNDELFKQVEIINARKIEEINPFVIQDSNSVKFVSYVNTKVQLRHDWNLFRYPFDKQVLKIILESQDGMDYRIILPDKNGLKIDSACFIPGWKINKSYIEKHFKSYPVNFGFHETKVIDKRFGQISYAIEVERKGWGLYFKIFSSLYLAFLVSFIAFFIRADFVDPRFGVSIGGLFASVANKYVVDSAIPESNSILLVDIVHILNFLLILMTILASTISLKYASKGDIVKSKIIDRKFAVFILLSYIIGNLIILVFGFLS